MVLNKSRARELLAMGNLRSLFINELGWDHHNAVLEIPLEASRFSLTALAQKRGMVVFHCPTPIGQDMPYSTLRHKIEHQVAKRAYEHIIVFTDAMNTIQVWQWVKREPGKAKSPREHIFRQTQAGEGLLQKLMAITFNLEEEEKLSLIDVTGRVHSGFDVDHITKRFYDRFQKEHTIFVKFISGITASADREWYASVMINRLMFVYFIQRKGFLDGDRDYLRNRLNRLRAEHGNDRFYSFYHYFLLRLFHEALGRKTRSLDLEKLVGRIPYLNGGLFDIHPLEMPDRYGKKIQIPDQVFENIFNYFDQYQWHLDERHRRNDNEINPDILGYIFEKYVNQKQMGAYYTKEDITDYVSKNSVIPFLFESVRTDCKIAFENSQGPTIWDQLKAEPDRYIHTAMRHGISWDVYANEGKGASLDVPRALPSYITDGIIPLKWHEQMNDAQTQLLELRKTWNMQAIREYALPRESWRDVVTRREHYHETKAKIDRGEVKTISDLIISNLDILTFAQDVIATCECPDLLRAFWRAIEKVTVLDPACGSGAFLFAALNVLEPLYEACLDRMQAFIDDCDTSNLKHCSEKFSDFRKILEDVDAHPNRCYFILKSIILNNLFGVDIMPEAVEICKLRFCLKLAAQVDPKTLQDNLGIEPLPDIDFNIQSGNSLVGFATEEGLQAFLSSQFDFENKLESINVRSLAADQAYDSFRLLQTDEAISPIELSVAKANVKARLSSLGSELDVYAADEHGVKKSGAYARAFKESHQPFHWFIGFHAIMRSGGFDVIIGNPPYVEYPGKLAYKVTGYDTERCGNLYALFMERSLTLLKKNGNFGFIVPVSSISGESYVSLYRLFQNKPLWLSSFSNRPGKLFDGVEQRLTVFLVNNSQSSNSAYSTHYQHWYAKERINLFDSLLYTTTRQWDVTGMPLKVGSLDEGRVLEAIFAQKNRLISYQSRNGQGSVWFHDSPTYFIRALAFEPNQGSKSKRSAHYHRIATVNEKSAFILSAILSSSLFYLYFKAISNCRDFGLKEWSNFPTPKLNNEDSNALTQLGKDYNECVKQCAKKCTRSYPSGIICYEEYYPARSKDLLDEIDYLLCQAYGLSTTEADFVINLDIRYRLGSEIEDSNLGE